MSSITNIRCCALQARPPRFVFANDTINRGKPGALRHLSFKAESRAEVDRMDVGLLEIGAARVAATGENPEYVPPGYYALFFEDCRASNARFSKLIRV